MLETRGLMLYVEQVGDILQAGLTIHSESCRDRRGEEKGWEQATRHFILPRHVSCSIYPALVTDQTSLTRFRNHFPWFLPFCMISFCFFNISFRYLVPSSFHRYSYFTVIENLLNYQLIDGRISANLKIFIHRDVENSSRRKFIIQRF